MNKQRLILKDLCIHREWTLFLDRDGVINAKIEGDYVRMWSQFKFLPGVRESIRILSKVFSQDCRRHQSKRGCKSPYDRIRLVAD